MKKEIDKFLEDKPSYDSGEPLAENMLLLKRTQLEYLYRIAESMGRDKGREDAEIFFREGAWVRVLGWIVFGGVIGFLIGLIF